MGSPLCVPTMAMAREQGVGGCNPSLTSILERVTLCAASPESRDGGVGVDTT